MSLQKPAAISLLVAASLLLAGCGREDGAAANTSTQTSASRRASPRYPKLQAELDSLLQVPLERDPAKRPLVLSERAANRQDWALGALERGYAQGGGTNKLWDSQMRAACRAYVDYSRGGATDRQYAALTNAVLAAAACRLSRSYAPIHASAVRARGYQREPGPVRARQSARVPGHGRQPSPPAL